MADKSVCLSSWLEQLRTERNFFLGTEHRSAVTWMPSQLRPQSVAFSSFTGSSLLFTSFPIIMPAIRLSHFGLCYPQLILTSEVFSWTTEPAPSGLHISNTPCFQSIIHRAARCFPTSFDHLTLLGRWLSGKEHKYEDLNSHPHYPHKIQD